MVFQGSKLCHYLWLCMACLDGRFQHWRLWQVPVIDLMDGPRASWMVRKTEHCWDGMHCHLLQDLSSVQWSWQLRLINTQVSSCGSIHTHWLHNIRAWADMMFDNDGRVPHFGTWAIWPEDQNFWFALCWFKHCMTSWRL